MNNEKLLKKVGQVVPEEILQALIDEWDPIINVGRTTRPTYPDFVKEVKHPEFELAGPSEFDVTKLEKCLHPKQVGGGGAIGNEIYEYLVAQKMLEGCLNLTDILAIQVRGIGFFRKIFTGLYLPAWKSVVLGRGGYLDVPYLCGYDDVVRLDWDWLGNDFDSDVPALRVAQVDPRDSEPKA